MWIIPRPIINQLTSVFAPDTEVLTSDSNECSRICAQSLMRRSNVPQSNFFLREWNAGRLTRLRFGAICDPSLGATFATEWTSCLVATPASHSAQPVSDSEPKTSGTSGHPSQMEFAFCAHESASLKTSRGTLRWDSPQSLVTWKNWVTKCRLDYLARKKLARPTAANEFSSWPTAAARDYKGESGSGRQERKGHPADTLPNAVAMYGQAVPVNPSTGGSRPESWRTPTSSDGEGGVMEMREGCAGRYKLRDHVVAVQNQAGVVQNQWLTPRANDPGEDKNFAKRMGDRSEHCHGSLTSQAKSWATPTVGDSHLASTPEAAAARIAEGKNTLSRHVVAVQNPQWATPQTRDNRSGGAEMWDNPERSRNLNDQIASQTKQNAKLNPRWVETLLGLPVGWVMASCASPVTIKPTSCECWETESFQQPQPKLFEC